MSDSRRTIRALLLASPLLLASCDTIDFAAIDVPSIDWPWKSSEAPPTAVTALREEPAPIPDGLQTDDLRAPFGAASP